MNAKKTIFLTRMDYVTLVTLIIVMNAHTDITQTDIHMEIEMFAQIVKKGMDLMFLLLILLLASHAKYKIVHNVTKIIRTVQFV